MNRILFKLRHVLYSFFGGRSNWRYVKTRLFSAYKWNEIKYVTIVSTGRTGTKFIYEHFNKSSLFFSRHQPVPETLDLSSSFVKGDIKFELAKRNFSHHRRHLLVGMKRKGKSIFLESDPDLSYLLPVIKSTVQNYKIVFIVRDPKTFVRSFASRIVSKNGIDRVKYDYDENWSVLPKNVDDPVEEEWSNYTIVEKGAWHWNFRNSKILEYIENDPNSIVIKYENLFNRDREGFHEIIDFLNLEDGFKESSINNGDFEKVNESKSYHLSAYDDWTSLQKGNFLKITKDLRLKFGYDYID